MKNMKKGMRNSDSRWEIIRKYSAKTGISDPKVDFFLKNQDSFMADFPHVPFWNKVVFGVDTGTYSGATTVAAEKNEKEWEMIYDFADRVIDDYKPHPAQERFFKSGRAWHFSGDWSGAPVEAEWSRVPNKLEKHNARD